MVVSFSVVPIGVGEELKDYIAGVLDLIDRSGLPYKLGAMQTTVEGDAEAVLALVMKCHAHLLEHAPRVLTHITIDDRRGATGRLDGKVRDVEQVLGRQLSHE